MTRGGNRIVILGAGFGGLVTAVLLAKKIHPKDEIVILDRSDKHTYKPWLYEVITGCLFEDTKKRAQALEETTSFSVKQVVSRFRNVRFRKAEVANCDFSQKHVVFTDGKTLKYDQLVVALGSDVSYFGIKGMKENASVVSFPQQSLEIRSKLMKCLEQIEEKNGTCHIIVAGAGASGTETAAELANYLHRLEVENGFERERVRLLLIDAAPNVLGRFSKTLTRWARKRLRKLGVDVWTDTMVQEAHKGHIVIAPRVAKAGEPTVNSPIDEQTRLQYDLLIWAGGIVPNAVVREFSLPKDERGRIKVLSTMQVEGHPDVYAVGDIISYQDGERFAPAAAWAAIEEAKVAAANLVRAGSKTYSLPRSFPAVVAVGGKYAVADVYGLLLKGRLAYYLRRIVDFNYFRKIMPIGQAVRHFKETMMMFSQND